MGRTHRARRRVAAVLLALGLSVPGVLPLPGLPVPGAAARTEVKDIRIGLHPDKSRLVLDMTGPATPQILGLADPYRMVVDLPGVFFALARDRNGDRGGLIRGLRYGLYQANTSRLVLDLDGPVLVREQFVIPPGEAHRPWRLVLDLVRTDAASYAARMRPPPPEPPVARPPPAAGPAPERESNPRPVVVIDPGHGGLDPGAQNENGTEKEITLAFGLVMKELMDADGRYKVVLTRETDVFLPLQERVRRAREANADLFLSLHANANENPHLSGFSVYTLSARASDAEAAALSAKENQADIIAGVNLNRYSEDVATILIDFAQTKTNERSVAFARDVLLDEVGKNTPLLNRPWRSAGFAVLKAPDVPSVLVELGYLTNNQEARLLKDATYRERLSRGIIAAVDRFFLRQNASAGSGDP